jgi:hypothetical protein
MRVVSCVRCGNAMSPQSWAPRVATPPGRSIVASAMAATQLLGVLGFALGFTALFRHHGHWQTSVALLAASAVAVFAGGNAHRGSLRGLLLAALFDVAVAYACLNKTMAVTTFAAASLNRAPPTLVHLIPMLTNSAGLFAIFAACACIAAIPQTRRFAAWRYEQLLQAVRTWGGVTPR